jgi:hypothetical protein
MPFDRNIAMASISTPKVFAGMVNCGPRVLRHGSTSRADEFIAPVESLVGSVRREYPDRVIVLHERQLRQILKQYFAYCHEVRPHRSLAHESPILRPVLLPHRGKVFEIPFVAGLHHQYLRQAA